MTAAVQHKETTMAGMFSFLSSSKTTKKSFRSSQLEFDTLEARTMPSVSVVKGDIVITQTDNNDTCTVKSHSINGWLYYDINDNGRVSHFDARSKNIHGVVRWEGLYGDD